MPKNGQGASKVGSTGLTVRQHRFVQEYLASEDMNASAAYVRAGYTNKFPDRGAHQLILKPAVQKAIQAAIARRGRRVNVTQDRVVEELARIAFLDIRDFYDTDGNLREIHALPESAAAALRGMDVAIEPGGEDGKAPTRVRKIRMADKVRALELLGRHMGMFDDRLKVTMDGDLAVRMERIEGRRASRD